MGGRWGGGSWANRNPYWIVPGWITTTDRGDPEAVEWGEPEVALFIPGATAKQGVGIGYPDFITERHSSGNANFSLWITETQKVSARVHLVDDKLLYSLLHQATIKGSPSAPLLVSTKGSPEGTKVRLPPWPFLPECPANATTPPLQDSARPGISLIMWLPGLRRVPERGESYGNLSTLFQTRSSTGGVSVDVIDQGGDASIRLSLYDAVGDVNMTVELDNQCSRWVQDSKRHFVAFNVDSGARLVSMMVDGVLCDGGVQSWERTPTQSDAISFQGWHFMPSGLNQIGGAADGVVGNITLSIYGQYLLTGEMLAAWRMGEEIIQHTTDHATDVVDNTGTV